MLNTFARQIDKLGSQNSFSGYAPGSKTIFNDCSGIRNDDFTLGWLTRSKSSM